MMSAPSPTSVGLLLGLSFFLGLAFEDFFAHTGSRRPGGIRTFPMLALAGGVLYLFDPAHFIPFTGGLLVLGAWLVVYYQSHLREHDEQGERDVGVVVLVLNVHAYLLGAVALALPHWIAVATTVSSVLLLTGREPLHNLARRVDVKEIITAGQFLILSIAPERAGDDVNEHHAASGLARTCCCVRPFLCELSGPTLLGSRSQRIVDGGLGRPLFLDCDDGCPCAAGERRICVQTLRQAGITLATGIMYLAFW